MPLLPPFPKRFTVDVVRSDGHRTTVFVDGAKRRLDIYPSAGNHRILLTLPDRNVILSLDPEAKIYSQTKIPTRQVFDPDTLYDWTEDGVEVIDGRKCRKFVGRDPADDPFYSERELCFIDSKTGMRRRVVTYNLEGNHALTVDYLNAKIGAPPKAVFKMPAGYKRAYHTMSYVDS